MRFSTVVFASALLISHFLSLSVSEGAALEKASTTIEKIGQVMGESQKRRSDSSYVVTGNYAPLDLLIPSKFGLTAGLIRNENSTLELEVLRAKLSIPFIIQDLGEFTDLRLSLLARTYFGSNSFNTHYGLSYFTMDMRLGNEILSRASNGAGSVDLVSTKAIGIVAGLGNRWVLARNFTVGIDWFSWAQPLYLFEKKSDILNSVTNENDKSNIEKAINVSAYFPRFSLLKVQLGMSF